MSMAKYTDSTGKEHYCNEKIVDLSKEMAEIRIHGYALHDHINKLMAASGKTIDLSESKIKLDEIINGIIAKYNECVALKLH
jgi:hypothetical protein